MIKGICFDLDGVYFLNGKANFIKNLTSLGVTEEEAKRVFLKSDEMNKLYKLGAMSDEEFWNFAAKEWNLNRTSKELIDLLISGYEINEQAVKLVKKLKASGYKTLICSNNFPARIKGLHGKFNFLNDFDTKIFSYEVCIDKPNKEIFEMLVKKSGLNPGEIVYSDDDETKILGAKELGIKTFIYTDFNAFTEHLKNLGVKI